jgi:hypothetical protein
MPEILNIDCDVVDLSVDGIKIAYRNRSYELPELFTINDVSNLIIRFSDGDITVIQVKFLRCFEDKGLGKTCFAGSILKGISPQRIENEQEYIQKHLDDFYDSRSEEYIDTTTQTHESIAEPVMS